MSNQIPDKDYVYSSTAQRTYCGNTALELAEQTGPKSFLPKISRLI